MSREHLIPYKPGQSGNPKGKAKGTRSFKTIFRQILQSKMAYPEVTGHDKKIPVMDIIAMRTVKDAMAGNHAARETILERTEGKVIPQSVEQDRPIVQMPAVIFNGKLAEFHVGDN